MKPEWAGVLVSLIGVIVTSVYVVVSVLMWKAIKRQADISEKQAEAAALQAGPAQEAVKAARDAADSALLNATALSNSQRAFVVFPPKLNIVRLTNEEGNLKHYNFHMFVQNRAESAAANAAASSSFHEEGMGEGRLSHIGLFDTVHQGSLNRTLNDRAPGQGCASIKEGVVYL